jgi:hypothetical protein
MPLFALPEEELKNLAIVSTFTLIFIIILIFAGKDLNKHKVNQS